MGTDEIAERFCRDVILRIARAAQATVRRYEPRCSLAMFATLHTARASLDCNFGSRHRTVPRAGFAAAQDDNVFVDRLLRRLSSQAFAYFHET
jgi:hypothetical protein